MDSGLLFSKLAKAAARFTGRPTCFMLALLVVLAWAASGPLFKFSDTWQLVINTGTTIITFLMVFMIQHTQNRDTEAMQIKLDELIRATRGASNHLIDMEGLEEQVLERLRKHYAQIAQRARDGLDEGVNAPAPDKADCQSSPADGS